MSKKSKRQAAMKTQAAAKGASAHRSAGAHPVAKKPAQSNHQPAKSSGGARGLSGGAHGLSGGARGLGGGARTFRYTPRPAGPDPKTVRIAAIVVAVLALAGAAYWGYTMREAMTAGIYAGLVALGIVAGLAITFAMKTEEMLVAVRRMVKR